MPTIQKLIPDDASVLSELLKKQSSQYRKVFFLLKLKAKKALFKLTLKLFKGLLLGNLAPNTDSWFFYASWLGLGV